MKYKFYDLGVSLYVRSLKCGSENRSNERIAEATNEANKAIAEATNATNARNVDATNEANLTMARENNELQQQLQEQQNAFNVQMWNMNNEYNSPQQQLARAAEAGINPNIVFGTPVASSPVQQTSLPDTEAPSFEAPHAERWQNIPAFHTVENSLAGSISRTIGDINTTMQSAKTFDEAQLAQIQGQFLPALLTANVKGANLENLVKSSNIKNIDTNTQLMQKQIQGIASNIEVNRAEVAKSYGELAKINEEAFGKYLENTWSQKTFDDRVKSVQLKNNLDKNTAWAIVQQVKIRQYLAPSEAGANWARARYDSAQAEFQEECIKRGLPAQTVRQVKVSADLYQSQSVGQDLQNDITREFGPEIAKQELDKKEYENSTPVRILNGVGEVVKDAGIAAGVYFGARSATGAGVYSTPITKDAVNRMNWNSSSTGQ